MELLERLAAQPGADERVTKLGEFYEHKQYHQLGELLTQLMEEDQR